MTIKERIGKRLNEIPAYVVTLEVADKMAMKMLRLPEEGEEASDECEPTSIYFDDGIEHKSCEGCQRVARASVNCPSEMRTGEAGV